MNEKDIARQLDFRSHLSEDWRTVHNLWRNIKTYVDAHGGGVSTFLALTDTPDSYSGSGGYYVKVNSGGTALEFVAGSVSGHAMLSSTHTDTTTGTVTRGDLITGQGSSPTWTRLAKGTDGKFLKAESADVVWASLLGTTDQVTVTNNSGNLTLSLPQSIATTSLVQFAGITIERSGSNPYIDLRDNSGGSRKHVYLETDLTNSRINFSGLQEGSGYWPLLMSFSKVTLTATDNSAFMITHAGGIGATTFRLKRTDQTYPNGAIQWLGSDDAVKVAFGTYYNVAAQGLEFVFLDGSLVTKFYFSPEGNLGVGQTTFGTSATKTIAISSGTAPSTSPVDAIQFYSADFAAGNAVPTFRTENGTVIQLNQTLVTSATPQFERMGLGGAASSVRVLDITASIGSGSSIWCAGATSTLTPDASGSGGAYYAAPTIATGASTTVTNGYGMWIAALGKGGTGTITNVYGLYLSNQTVGSTNWSLYSAGAVNLASWSRFGSYLELTEMSAPSTPSSGFGRLYVKTDGKIYFLNDGATEYDLTASGGSHAFLSSTHTDVVAASPVLGDLIYANSTPNWTKLAGNTTTTKNFLTQTGTGSVSAAPSWGTIAAADLPAHNLLSTQHGDTTAGSVVRGDIIIGDSTPKWIRLAKGTSGFFLKAGASDVAWSAHGLTASDVGAVPTSRNVSTTSPLSGGGDLSSDRTLSIGGLSSIGSANYVVGVNSGATGWEYKQIIQTANRVTVTHGAGSITLSGPQDIHTSAAPQFFGLGLGVGWTDSKKLVITGGVDPATDASCYGLQIYSLSLTPGTSYDAYFVSVAGTVVAGTGETIGGAYGIAQGGMTKSGSGTITVAYGIYSSSPSLATTNWNIYASGSTGSYFGGFVRHASYIEVAEIAAPGTPGSGYGRLYGASDGKVYYVNDGGTTYDLTLGGGSPSAHNFLDSTVHNNTLTGTPVLGDLIHGNSTPAWAKLAGNTTTTKKFLNQTGTGSVSAVPSWDAIVQADCGGLTTTSDVRHARLSLGAAVPSANILSVLGTLDSGAADTYGILVNPTLESDTTVGSIGVGINPIYNVPTAESRGYAYALWIGLGSKTGTGTIDTAVGAYINSPSIGTTNRSLMVTGAALATFAPAVQFGTYIDIAEQSAPATPSSGYGRLYFKTDGYFYAKNDGGTESQITGVSAGGGKLKSQAFTSDGTWTCPSGVTLVWVTAVGGGGGGEAGITSTRGGGGGGGGAFYYRYPVTVSGNVSVTIGTAGSAGTGSSGANGGTGGNTTFGSALTAHGGLGGGISGSGYGGAGGGDVGFGAAQSTAGSAGNAPTIRGSFYIPGAGGGAGTTTTPTSGGAGAYQVRFGGGSGGASTYGGGGGAGALGTGGTGGTSGVAGTAGATNGGAGGGGGWGGASYTAGGAGGTGWLLVEWVE